MQNSNDDIIIEADKPSKPNGKRESESHKGGEKTARSSCIGTFFAFFGIVLSLLWLSNISFGIFEIPDYLPLIGNIDEAFFTMLLLWCLSYLGIEIPFMNLQKKGKFQSGTYKNRF